MESERSQLIQIVKEQAELFILDAGEFFPFCMCLNADDKIIPRGAYIEADNDCPPSLELIELLKESIITDLQKGQLKIGVIAIDGRIKELDQIFDVIEMRFYEVDKRHKKVYKYCIKNSRVDFVLA